MEYHMEHFLSNKGRNHSFHLHTVGVTTSVPFSLSVMGAINCQLDGIAVDACGGL